MFFEDFAAVVVVAELGLLVGQLGGPDTLTLLLLTESSSHQIHLVWLAVLGDTVP